jgi:hypothetical protein
MEKRRNAVKNDFDPGVAGFRAVWRQRGFWIASAFALRASRM